MLQAVHSRPMVGLPQDDSKSRVPAGDDVERSMGTPGAMNACTRLLQLAGQGGGLVE